MGRGQAVNTQPEKSDAIGRLTDLAEHMRRVARELLVGRHPIPPDLADYSIELYGEAAMIDDWIANLAGGVRLMKLLELMIKGLALDDLYLDIETLSKPEDHPYTLELCKFYAAANMQRILELELELYGCLDSDL